MNFFSLIAEAAAFNLDMGGWIALVSNIGAGGASLLMAFWFLNYLKTVQISRLEELKQVQIDRSADLFEYRKNIEKLSDDFKLELRHITEEFRTHDNEIRKQFQEQITTLSAQWLLSIQESTKAMYAIEKTVTATQLSVDNLQKAVVWLSQHSAGSTPSDSPDKGKIVTGIVGGDKTS